MTWEIFLLVLMSAALHPFRDILLKGLYAPGLCYLSISLFWMLFATGHALVTDAPLFLPIDYIPQVFGSAIGLFAYYYGTLLTLEKGDISVYYPIIRSSPIFVVLVGWILLDHSYSIILLLGIATVLSGVFLIQRQAIPKDHTKPKKLVAEPKLLLIALIAMSGSGIYSLVDASAMQASSAPQIPDLELSTFLIWVYALLTMIFWITFSIKTQSYMPLGKQIGTIWKQHPWRILSASTLSYLSYIFILEAYDRGANVAAVTSLRLGSIPLGVILSALLLSEQNLTKRLLSSCIIVAGILIIIVDG
ncbi:hypothetical protein WH96_18815 [Kiloniella spongiae]|uniref:Uncharacterized protein n=1 Tax=Kiloniella spongiae TaxID=1489064 RepID=A0A0H2MR80_9PROT|nr:EamA family transporter [Kiloniella spongiae]KLN59195.1 hypothetical protein WH96_18815 [Kiloniella spongiae]